MASTQTRAIARAGDARCYVSKKGKMKNITLSLLAFLILTGCATGGHVKHPPQLINDSEYSDVIIKRDNAFLGGGISFTFTINGEDIYVFRNSDKYEFKLTPGEYIFGVKSSGGWQVYGNFNEITVNLERNKVYIYRLVPDMSSGARIQRSSK